MRSIRRCDMNVEARVARKEGDLGDFTSCVVLVSSGMLGHSYAELRPPGGNERLELRPTEGRHLAGSYT